MSKKTFALIHFPFFQLDPEKGRGVEYFIKQTLEIEGNKVLIIRPDIPFFVFFYKIIRNLNKVLNKEYHYYRKKIILNSLAKSTNAKLENLDFDYAISFGTLPMYNVVTSKPKIMWSDTTFSNILNYYNDYKKLSKNDINEFQEVELNGLNNSDYIFLTSGWATKSAVNDYKIDKNKVFELPFGANLLEEISEKEIDFEKKAHSLNELNLLFIGKNWERKGGKLVLELCKKLTRYNVKYQMNIIGCNPNIPNELKKNVNVYGLLNKSVEKENKLFNEIIRDSHFFIMPSLAEAFGHVYCEANAYGIPALALNTGGVPSVILDGLNGYTFEIEDFIDKSSDYLSNIKSKKEEYIGLCETSRNRYIDHLNWNSSIKKLLKIIEPD